MELINCHYSALLYFGNMRAYNHKEFVKDNVHIQTSPGGSLFPYYYKDGELFCLHFGSYFSDEDGVIAMMKAEEEFVTEHHRPMGIWIDFYETKLTDRVIQEFIEMLKHIKSQTTKLGIVGCSFITWWKMNRLIKKSELLSSLPVKYFDDPEAAKTWLVSELE
jgi:hypothetical protein